MFMKHLMAAAAMLAASLGLAQAQQAAPLRLGALVMSTNAPAETMANNVPVYRRVLAQLSETLNQRGIQIYEADRVAAGMLVPGKTRYQDDELMEVARAVARTTPIDVVVFFEVIADIEQMVPANQTTGGTINIAYPRVRMPGRILNVRTGQLVAAFEVDPGKLQPLPPRCAAECVYREVGNDARLLASELGDALVTKLANWNAGGVDRRTQGSAGAPAAPATAAAPRAACEGMSGDYTIMLRDFRQAELLKFEELLRGYSCYENMRPLRSGATFTEYAYQTSAGSQQLNRNLRLSLDYLDLQAQVRFDGSRFEVSNITTRRPAERPLDAPAAPQATK